MEIGDTKIPDKMLEIAADEFFRAASMNGRPSCTDRERLEFVLVAVVRWLRYDILHERNVDFHQAILDAERKRFPGSDTDLSVIARRVDFEYGVSFARHYIRQLFEIQKREEEQKDIISIANNLIANSDWRSADLYHALLEAFRLGEAFNAKESKS